MRVLQVVNTLDRGGAERLVIKLAEKLKEHGIESDILVLKRGSREYDSGDLEVISLDSESVYNVSNLFKIGEYMKNYNLVHVHLFPSFYWVALSPGEKPPLVLTEHGTTNRRRSIKILKFLERWIYSRYAKIVAVSESVERSLKEWLGDKLSDRITVIHNGVDLSEFKTFERRTRVGKTKKLVMVANFSGHKDHITLVRAMEYLKNDAVLVLVGEGKGKESVENEVRRLRLEERVIFTGSVENTFDILKDCDVYVHSVKDEGFGLAVLEAMAMGLPVVVSDLDSMRELVGDSGLYFRRGDPRFLADVLNDLLSDTKKLDEFAKRSVQRARVFDIDTTVREYKSLYEEVLRT